MTQNHLGGAGGPKTLSDPEFNSHVADKQGGTGCCIADVDLTGCGFGLGGSVVLDAAAARSFHGPVGKGTYGWLGIVSHACMSACAYTTLLARALILLGDNPSSD